MTLAAISTGLAILALIGLVVGLVVLVVVVVLLSAVGGAVRGIRGHVRDIPEIAPFITNGVQGVDELRRTNQLANSVPPLAEAYLAKLGVSGPARPASSPSPQSGAGGNVGISGGKA